MPKLQPIFKQKIWTQARKIIKDEFVRDPNTGSMRHAFLCNIAGLLQTEAGLNFALSNKVADDIIKLCFEDTYY